MAKKKKNHKKQQKKVNQARKKHLQMQQTTDSLNDQSKAVVPSQVTPPDVETTFSKKLKEVISETEEVTKKSLWNRIILLSAPSGYTGSSNSFAKKMLKSFLVILLLAVLVSVTMALEIMADGRVLPRVVLAKNDIGLERYEDLSQKLQQEISQYQSGALTFSYGEKSVSLPLVELGITFDTEKTLSSLPVFKFDQDGVFKMVGSVIHQREFQPVYQYDRQKIFDLLERKLDLSSARAKSAHFVVGEKKSLEIVAEKSGFKLDLNQLENKLNENLNTLSVGEISLATIAEEPTVLVADLESAKQDLQVKLENEIQINYGKQNWKFKALQKTALIDFEKSNDQVVIKINSSKLDSELGEEIFSKIEKPVSHVKIFYDEKGQIQFEGRALSGIEIDREMFENDLELALNSIGQEINIVTNERKPELIIDEKLQEIGIKELISTGHTAFAGSPNNRRHNIATAMAKFNGIIIKSGETFSFNDNLGEVDGSTGYKLELVIKAEGTVPEYGGGVCQVSSTVFKAGLLSGLPIVERAPHSYAVGYYAQVDGYGLDSTIYPGVKDLKFTNNTPGAILIQTFIDGNDAYVNFYGTSDGRQVKLENYWRGNYRGAGGTQLIPTKTLPPGARKQIETAHGGFDASWDRVIIDGTGVESREKVYSVYRATANRILVGEE
jgi:vancomycin resistance protein YoaR